MEAAYLLAIMVILLAGIAAAANILRRHNNEPSTPEYAPYERKPALFTPAERSFLNVLELAVGDRFRVFGKVRLLDLVDTRRGLDNSARAKAQNKLKAKHIDFVLCAKDTLEIACLIELDDKSHARESRRQRDAFVEGLCAAVGLPLARIPAKAAYTVDTVRDTVFNAIRRNISGAA